jgi:DNA-directed RNA polymerase beta' subunit
LRFPSDARLERNSIAPLTAEQIRERAPKAVTKPETMNYRTLLPEPGGLYDPKLFGPGTVIDAPPIALDEPYKPRKTQFARITLVESIVHPLFAAHVPAELAALIGRPISEVEAAVTTLAGGSALTAALAAAGHASLVLREIPLIPPDLRPLQRNEDELWRSSPLNELYRRVISHNLRLEKLLAQDVSETIANQEYAQLHDLVRRLFENDEQPSPICDPAGEPFPSVRSLCGGTPALFRALQDLERHRDDEVLSGRLHLARSTVFALGFELLPRDDR